MATASAERSPLVAAGRALRLAYVTAQFPFGVAETFLLPEVEALAERVDTLRLVPTRPPAAVEHDDLRRLVELSDRAPLLSGAVVAGAARELARQPARSARRVHALRRSRSVSVLAKNATVVPKALWLARLLRAHRIDHVHAHWGGTSSTLAMVAAGIADLPWSLTLHRWDIAEDNLLAAKLGSASFARTISEHGAKEIGARVPGARVDVLHLGVDTGDAPALDVAERIERKRRTGAPLRLLAVGDLVPVKGHDLLLELFALLRRRAPERNLRLDLVGIGPLRGALEAQAERLGVADRVGFLGLVSHDRLLRLMRNGHWELIVHPSVDLPDLHEGIPVVLMEAMSAGIPVVASRSGGVAELVRPGGGILVPERDAGLFASAIEALLDAPELAQEHAHGGRARVRSSFDADRIADELVARFVAASRPLAVR